MLQGLACVPTSMRVEERDFNAEIMIGMGDGGLVDKDEGGCLSVSIKNDCGSLRAIAQARCYSCRTIIILSIQYVTSSWATYLDDRDCIRWQYGCTPRNHLFCGFRTHAQRSRFRFRFCVPEPPLRLQLYRHRFIGSNGTFCSY